MASPSSGSGCEVKNCQGVDAPHSSPMNSIGVNGASAPAPRRSPGRAVEGGDEPVAGGPVADLIVVLRVRRRTARPGCVRCRPAGRVRPRKLTRRAVVEEPVVSTLASAGERPKSA